MQNSSAEMNLPVKTKSGTGRRTVFVVTLALLIIALGVAMSLSLRFFPGATERLAALLVTLFSREERLEVTSDKADLSVNDVFTLSYKHVGRDNDGTYAVTYGCSTKVELALVTLVGTSTQTSKIACDNQIDITPAEGEKYGSVSMTTLSTTESISAVPVSIAFLPEGTTTPSVKGTAIIVIQNENPTTSTPVTPIPTTTPKKTAPPKAGTPTTYVPLPGGTTAGPVSTSSYQVASGVPTQTGRPDFAVRIIETGVVDKVTGTFTATSSFRSSDRIAVKFEVRNDGGRDSGSWYFNAVLPTFPSHIFTSPSQASLVPGARIEFTLGFDNIAMSVNMSHDFVVNADPGSSIGEASETNNIAKVTITDVTP